MNGHEDTLVGASKVELVRRIPAALSVNRRGRVPGCAVLLARPGIGC